MTFSHNPNNPAGLHAIDFLPTTSPPPNFTVTDLNTGVSIGESGIPAGTSDPTILFNEADAVMSLKIVANIDSVTINATGGLGNDMIFLHGGHNMVLTACGTKVVTSGTGNDLIETGNLDDGYGARDAWTIIANFHKGDTAVLLSNQFDFSQADFAMLPGVSGGGLTFEWPGANGGHQALSLAGYSQSDISTRLTLTPESSFLEIKAV